MKLIHFSLVFLFTIFLKECNSCFRIPDLDPFRKMIPRDKDFTFPKQEVIKGRGGKCGTFYQSFLIFCFPLILI